MKIISYSFSLMFMVSSNLIVRARVRDLFITTEAWGILNLPQDYDLHPPVSQVHRRGSHREGCFVLGDRR